MVSCLHRENKQGNIWFAPFPLRKAPSCPGRDVPGPYASAARDIWPETVVRDGPEQVPSPEPEVSFAGVEA